MTTIGRVSLRFVLRLATVVACGASCGGALAAELPPGFAQDVFVDGLHDPNAMAFAPDGRLFVSERISGRLRVVRNGKLLAEPFVTVSVPPEHPGKREEAAQPGFRYSGIYHYGTYRSSGLRGIAFDPEFERNGYVYLYYMNDSPRVNRVSRFTARRDNPNRAEVGSEKVLLDIPMHARGPEPVRDGGSHNGGALLFGRDGKLYVSVGDGWNPAPADAPQDLTNLIGKVLRINRDGSVPEDNPFCDTPGARPEIWALGFRNPYTMTIHPQTGAIYLNDVVWGKETVYELVRGGNYQHPSPAGHGEKQRPIHSAAGLIAGGTWYFGDMFPDEYRGSYLLSDWRAGVIRRMISERDRRVVDFARGLEYPTYLLVGPDGAIYWLSANYELLGGKVFRIDYDAGRANEFEPPRAADDFLPAHDLIAHWPLDGDQGDVARDVSGNGRHGRVRGGAAWAPAAAETSGESDGGGDRGLRLDGNDGRVEVGPLELDTPGLTLAAWIRPQSFLPGMADNRIVSKAVGDQEQDHVWMLSTVRSGNEIRLRFRLRAGGQTRTLIASRGRVAAGEWTHVAATYDGGSMRLFQNGEDVGWMAASGPPGGHDSAPLWLGDNPPHVGSRPFHGRLRDVRLYGRALTPGEVLALVEVTAPGPRPRLRGERREVIEAYRTAVDLSGDVDRGRAVYRERCAACHRLEGYGTTVGPELLAEESADGGAEGADGPLSRDKAWLLEAILDPSRDVAPEYWNYFVQTDDGRTLEGLLVDESREGLTLRSLNGENRTVRREEVELFERLDRSLMPERLEAELTPQDLADLLEYLTAMGRAASREKGDNG